MSDHEPTIIPDNESAGRALQASMEMYTRSVALTIIQSVRSFVISCDHEFIPAVLLHKALDLMAREMTETGKQRNHD